MIPEDFFPDSEIITMFDGGEMTTDSEMMRGVWPDWLPRDFDHQILARAGLRGTHALLRAKLPDGTPGWRVWSIAELVALTEPALRWPARLR